MTARVSTFRTLDALRGVAALWVVMAHSCAPFLAAADPRFLRWPIYAFSARGQLGVVLFFLISGYCIMATAYGALVSGKTLRRWAYERIRRIYPPYVAACLLILATAQGLSFAQAHHIIAHIHHPYEFDGGARFWIANALLVQTEVHEPFINFVSWSLCYEIIFYVIVGGMLGVSRIVTQGRAAEKSLLWLATAIGSLTIGSLIWLVIAPQTCPFPMDRWYQFGAGALLFLTIELTSDRFVGYSRFLRNMAVGQLWMTAVLIGLFAALRDTDVGSIYEPSSRLQAILLIVFAIAIWILRPLDVRVSAVAAMRPLFWIGSFSYGLYLVHTIILGFVDFPLRRLGLTGNLYLVTYLIQIGAALALGRFFFWAIERHFISSRQKERISGELAFKSDLADNSVLAVVEPG